MIRAKILILGMTLGYFFPNSATASWRRQDSSFCMPATNSISYSRSGQYGLELASGDWYCPYIEDTLFERSLIAGINIHVWDNNSGDSTTARECVQNYASYSGVCSGLSTTAAYVGYATINLQGYSWKQYPADWAYIFVHGGVQQYLTGFYVYTN